tara:strand:- start:293 stop:535 length:243 start_codon:yes stop_codon:yes gene_type:complete
LPLDPDHRDAKNVLSVKVAKVENTTIGNVTTVELAYTLRNDTPNLIMGITGNFITRGKKANLNMETTETSVINLKLKMGV